MSEPPPNALDMLVDLLKESGMSMVFWVCPSGCRGQVKWNEQKTDAVCAVCGVKRSDQAASAPL